MISELVYVALIMYGVYIRKKFNERWTNSFIALIAFLLLMSVWQTVSLNYFEFSPDVRKFGTLTIGLARLIILILFIGVVVKELYPYLKSKIEKISKR